MLTQTPQTPAPDAAQIHSALQRIADVLGMHTCWLYQRRYHFSVGAGWTLALSADSAGRFRVDTCWHTRTVSSLWVLPHDSASLAAVVAARRELLGVPPPAGLCDEPRDLRGFDS